MKLGKSKEMETLTKRQMQVLEKMVDGLSYTEIAKELFISPETVKTHKKNMYSKLNVKNHIGAIKIYLINEIAIGFIS